MNPEQWKEEIQKLAEITEWDLEDYQKRVTETSLEKLEQSPWKRQRKWGGSVLLADRAGGSTRTGGTALVDEMVWASKSA